jgi:cytochrome c oxidase cbb3-type subunit IV
MLYNIAHSLLRDVENVNAFGLFSLVIFFGFFTGVLFWVFRLKKNYLNHMGDLPLEGGERPKNSNDKIQPEKL